MKHLNIRVTGKVQEVYFRHTALKTAESLGLGGFVRNEPEGSVYAEVEGTEDDVNKFVDWAKQGPSQAAVLTVETEEGEVKGYDSFEIR